MTWRGFLIAGLILFMAFMPTIRFLCGLVWELVVFTIKVKIAKKIWVE